MAGRTRRRLPLCGAGRNISDDGATALLQVTLGSDPDGVLAIDTIQPLRDAARQAVAQMDGAQANGGPARRGHAAAADTRAVSDPDRSSSCRRCWR